MTRPVCLLVVCLSLPAWSGAQTPPAGAGDPDPDLATVVAEPDFTLAALPTSLRTPAGKAVFRMTHRFTRPIAAGNAGDFFSSLFGFDGGAKIGLELRYGLWSGTDVTIHRTSDRTIQFLGRYELVHQTATVPLTVTLLGGIEGRNNFALSDELELADTGVWTGSVGAIVSRRIGDRGAVYLEPIAVFNANVSPLEVDRDPHAFVLGAGIRWRLAGRTYVLAEAGPRVAGYDAGAHHVSFGIEKRAGGHIFQLNVSNSLATTMGQIARGGSPFDDWYIGFNLTRRFW